MYAGTIIEYIDNSEIPNIEVDQESSDPFFIAAFSSEKGPEDPTVIAGDNFYKLYVTPDNSQDTGYFIPFAKHGQPLLQAANIVDNGGKLYAKRIVADDATLANVIISAKVTKQSEGVAKVGYTYSHLEGAKKLNDVIEAAGDIHGEMKYTGTLTAGNYCFKDGEGKYHEFTLAEDIQDGDTITWVAGETKVIVAAEGKEAVEATLNDVETSSLTEVTFELTKVFPILIITDNGRGVSKKKFRLIPSYEYSRDQDFMIYNLQIVEENRVLVNPLVSLDPEAIFLNESISIENQFKSVLGQVKTKFFEDSYNQFIEAIADITGETPEEVKTIDVINATTRKGEALTTIVTETVLNENVDIDLQNAYGNQLFGGSNGKFGDKPMGTEEYADKLIEFFTGQYTDDVYDSDNYKFDVIFDANYPNKVKKAIEDYVMFREDVFFFCDFGTKVHNYADIKEIINPLADNEDHRHADSKFIAYYHNFWDMLDPYTKKAITVTITYDLAGYCVDHFRNGRVRPFAGQLYGFTFPNAIQGTVNFVPKIIPEVNQKQQLTDSRVNYIAYYDGIPTLDSEYTSQAKHTQFSYINNVLATQEVVKEIRTVCPKNRYTFLGKESLNRYKADVESMVLSKYRANFETLEMVYLGDSSYELNKIFYAGINVRFRNFIQTEIFKVYALL